MRMITRSIPVAALALCLGTAALSAQEPSNGTFQWYVGGQGGAMIFRTPDQDASAIPTFGGQALIVAKRTGLLLSVEEAVGSDEVSSYSDAGGVQSVTFNDIRKYSAVLMAFPIRSAVQPYLGVGYGIMHVVNPQATGLTGSNGIANELGSTGFGTFLGGLTFQLGRFMAFGQYQVTTAPSNDVVTDEAGIIVATGRLLEGPTHTFTGGLRFGLGSAREGAKTGGY
ncbi:MAG: hypothetical protein H0T68_05325 [Gemmatimonadales bacterium]|nr:hypothetical protein [Gemmatimonadales bacterium]